MFNTEEIKSVLAHWPVAKTSRPTIEAVPQGLSGAFVTRVKLPPDSYAILDSSTTPARSSSMTRLWALKAWPPGTSAARVTAIHDQIRKASLRCELLAPAEPIQEGKTTVTALDRVWDLSPWIVGSPLPLDADSFNLTLAGETLARVHDALNAGESRGGSDATRDFGGPPFSGSISCLSRRRRRLAELDRRLPRLLAEHFSFDLIFSLLKAQITPPGGSSELSLQGLARSLASAMKVLQRYWGPQCHRILESLEQLDRQRGSFPVRTVLRDVHREHILFDPEGHQAAGIIDYDALGKDSPAADFARFAGSFDRSVDDVLETLAAGYRRVRPFSKSESELTRCLIQANVVGGLANWVVWLLLDRRCFACEPSVIQGRISHLIASNCRI